MRATDKPLAREILQLLLRSAKRDTVRSIYERIAPFNDGAIHSAQNPAGTETGRFSHSDTFIYEGGSTNLANLPKRVGALDALFNVRECVEENTLVLMKDLTWKPIKDVNVGEEIVAFQEHSKQHKGRRWRFAEVTAKTVSQKEAFEVVTDKGTIIATGDHPFLVKRGKHPWGTWAWLPVNRFTWGIKSKLAWAFAPNDAVMSYEAGWLSGFFDGEGCLALENGKTAELIASQKAGLVCERAKAYIDALGFSYRERESTRANILTITGDHRGGNTQEMMRFLSIIRPERLLNNFQKQCPDTKVGFKTTNVVSITPVGVKTVIDITTTEHTFIANGFAVHNCIIPHEGRVLWKADYSRAEARWCAYIAEDEERIRLYEQGIDDYKYFCAVMEWDDPSRWQEVDKSRRNAIGKVGILSGQYQVSWRTMMDSVNGQYDQTGVAIDARTARKMVDIWPRLFPRTVEWWGEVREQVLMHGFLVNPFGRRRDFFGRTDTESAKAAVVREAIAFGPQSANADCLNHALKALYYTYDPEGIKLKQKEWQVDIPQVLLELNLQVHDEIVGHCTPQRIAAVSKTVRGIMERTLQVNGRMLVIPAEFEASSKNWSSCKLVA